MSSATAPVASDRFRGLMIGLLVGDCLGRPIEGCRSVPQSYLDEVTTSPPRLYSDDSAMAIALAESLLQCDGFNGADMAMRFATDWRESERGYGGGVVRIFTEVLKGRDWREAARGQFGGEGSYGNGGAMRVAPVALWAAADPEELLDLAAATASVTHTHPVGVEGAVVQAVSARRALSSSAGTAFDTEGLLDELADVVQTGEFRSKFDILASCLDRDDDERARLHLGNWVRAQDSVVTALYCFLLSTSFEDALVRAIRMAGDTDTIGAMTGALAGAFYGMGAIPEPWRDFEEADRFLAVADSMFNRPDRP